MRVLLISAKSSDLCNAEYVVDGETQVESDGYCPEIKGIGAGDYIQFRIDLDTGKLLDYDPISHKDLMEELTDDEWEEEEDDDVYEDGLNTDEHSPKVIDPEVLDASLNKLLDETDTYSLGF